MTYDLYIATQSEPTEAQIRALIAQQKDLRVSGGLGKHTNLLVERISVEGKEPLFTIDGSPAESDDLPPALATAISSPRWSALISIPYSGSPDAARAALEVAMGLGQRHRGVVFDPQTEETILPQGQRKRPAPIKERRVDVVELEWFFPLSALGGNTPSRLLEIFRRTMPDAVPRRFDGRRFEAGKDEPFVEYWKEEAASARYLHLWGWTAKWPWYESFVMFRREPEWDHPHGVPAWVLSTSIDLEPLASQPDLRASLFDLFVSIASTLGAFYAAGYVVRQYIFDGRELLSDNQTESLSTYLWEGLPNFPTWLTWFGEPYRREVAGALQNAPVEEHPAGLFLRMGDRPLNQEELAGWFPNIPARLLASTPPSDRHVPAIF